MTTTQIIVQPYDPAWARSFLAIRAEIRAALGSLALRVEHVGSTSVPGLPAKPIIDVDVVIRDMSLLGEVIARLREAGYLHEGDLGVAGREAFRYDGKEHLMKHHLYVCPLDSAELRRHLAFRNYLRAHPGAAREYGRVKREGAALYPNDIDRYLAHKAPFIGRVYRELGL